MTSQLSSSHSTIVNSSWLKGTEVISHENKWVPDDQTKQVKIESQSLVIIFPVKSKQFNDINELNLKKLQPLAESSLSTFRYLQARE